AAAPKADFDEAAELVGELDVAVIDGVHGDALPGLVPVYLLRRRAFRRQHAPKLSDHLLQARHPHHDRTFLSARVRLHGRAPYIASRVPLPERRAFRGKGTPARDLSHDFV